MRIQKSLNIHWTTLTKLFCLWTFPLLDVSSPKCQLLVPSSICQLITDVFSLYTKHCNSSGPTVKLLKFADNTASICLAVRWRVCLETGGWLAGAVVQVGVQQKIHPQKGSTVAELQQPRKVNLPQGILMQLYFAVCLLGSCITIW